MPSAYTGFDVKLDNNDGTETLVPSVTVKAYDIQDANPATGVGAIALPDVNADVNGHVPAGTFNIAVGRKVRFSWTRAADGRCGSATTTTT
jgi:hypothetical protein